MVYDYVFTSKYNVSNYCKVGTRLPFPSEIVMLYEHGRMPRHQKHVYLVSALNGRPGIMVLNDVSRFSVYYFKERMRGTLEYFTHKVCIEEEMYDRHLATAVVIILILAVLVLYFYIIIRAACKRRCVSRPPPPAVTV